MSPLHRLRDHAGDVWARLAAVAETIGYHRAVWREAMAADKAGPRDPPLGRAELAFLPAALEVAETPAAPAARLIGATIVAFFTVAIAWGCFGELDIVATAAGKVVPSERIKIIQPIETAIVRQIRVREGMPVTAGQSLIELEVTGGQADVERLRHDLDNGRADAARLEALLADDPMTVFRAPAGVAEALISLQRHFLDSQWREHQARLSALDGERARRQAELGTTQAEVARLTETGTVVRDRVERRRPLAAKGILPQVEFLKDERELAEVTGQHLVEVSKIAGGLAAIEALTRQQTQARAEFRRDAVAKLSETRARVASLEQELAKATDRQRVQVLTAPVDGVAQQLAVHTVGGVVTPAQQLLVVVPAGAVLEVEAQLPNKDIGFVEVGQNAEIKVDAFPFTRYGTLAGTVETVSLDAVPDDKTKEFLFPVRLSLARPAIHAENGKLIPLTPGMTVSAEIKTGTRRPIDYVLAPLQKYRDESGRER